MAKEKAEEKAKEKAKLQLPMPRPKLKPVIQPDGEETSVIIQPTPPRTRVKVLIAGPANVTSNSPNVVIMRTG